ncbi:MAG TPA: S8 family serine peptidase [Polyangiaceae bacterium]|nr:S8 family serine peptidase [Polyangiaceae bacterium]
MPRYLLALKPGERAVSARSTQLTAKARICQIDAVRSDSACTNRRNDLRAWLQKQKLVGGLGSLDRSRPPVIGIETVTLLEDVAKDLQECGLGYNVFPDRIVPLVSPNKVGPITDEPIPWHVGFTGIDIDRRTLTGKGAQIAVLDTGIDTAHPRLNGRVQKTVDFDTQRDVFVEVEPRDTDGHGTHVAGIIAARGFGIAPDARLLSCIAFPRGRGSSKLLADALEWAVKNPDVHIVNISGGYAEQEDTFADAIDAARRAGVIVICAVGNEGVNTSRSPANLPAALAVGAVDDQKRVASFSGGQELQSGATVPDLVAPGVMISSTIKGPNEGDVKYQAWNGTSMAAPIVAGLAALLIEQRHDISADELIAKLLDDCESMAVPAKRGGGGRVRFVPQ